MIVSPSRLQDMQIRANMLEVIEICLRNGLTEQAKEIGEYSKQLAKKIAIHNYDKEDAWYRKELAMMRV